MERTNKSGYSRMPIFENSPLIPPERKSPNIGIVSQTPMILPEIADAIRKGHYTILVNDPSICAWGFAVLNAKNEILETGCIKTAGGGKKMRIRKGDDTIRRISEINQVLLRTINKWNIAFMVSELPHGSQNASAAVMQGVVSGIMQTISDTLSIPVEWFSEGDSKKCLLGKISAEKKETIAAVSKLYGTKWKSGTKYIDEAVADALSIHYVATKQSSSLQLLMK